MELSPLVDSIAKIFYLNESTLDCIHALYSGHEEALFGKLLLNLIECMRFFDPRYLTLAAAVAKWPTVTYEAFMQLHGCAHQEAARRRGEAEAAAGQESAAGR